MMNSASIAGKYKYKTSYFDERLIRFRYSLIKKITKNAIPLFFRGRDIISFDPLANGSYEPDIKYLFEFLAQEGFNDFFIDIGANIGLSSCLSGRYFKEIHMFEPNELALGILKVNAKIALKGINYHIHEYALGSNTETLKMYVPLDNWGGAFIKSKDNEYNQGTAEIGSSAYSASDLEMIDVKVESAEETLSNLFKELQDKNLSNGVIKIDVEGYEKFIINTIFKVLTRPVKVFVIFENWKDDLDLKSINLPPNTSIYRLAEKSIKWPFNKSRSIRDTVAIIGGGYQKRLEPAMPGQLGGTLVIDATEGL